jgi:hypothetical protein
VVVDEADRAVRDEGIHEFAPLTKGEALAAWSLKVGPLVDDDGCGCGADRVFRANRVGARSWADNEKRADDNGHHGGDRRDDAEEY